MNVLSLVEWLSKYLVLGISIPIKMTGYRKKMNEIYTPKYFTAEEVQGLDEGLVRMLDTARSIAGVPFTITCGLRTVEENAGVGGVSDSAHLRGKAVDLRGGSSAAHFAIVKGAIIAGFRRIGVYHNSDGTPCHVHLDIDDTLPLDVLWGGVSH